jgi:large subunit ribosomal protein L18
MGKTNPRQTGRLRRKKHIKKIVRGTSERPRLSVFRSAKHIYAQIIDDVTGKTVVQASSLGLEVKGGNKAGAEAVGKLVGERAQAAGVAKVVFDRNGYLYHGRVAALADAAREAGLEF